MLILFVYHYPDSIEYVHLSVKMTSCSNVKQSETKTKNTQNTSSQIENLFVFWFVGRIKVHRIDILSL